MSQAPREEELLRSVALQNANSIMRARNRAEDELNEAREALRRSEERLRATFEQAAVGIATSDLQGRYLDMNQRFCDMLGFSAQELRGKSFRDVTHPDDVAESDQQKRRLLAGEQREYRREKRYVRRDGSVLWALTTVTMVRDSRGAPVEMIGVIDDIGERREAQEALQRSEAFSRGIVESSPDCIKTLTLEGILIWISDRGCRILGISDPSVFQGRPYADLWEGDDRAPAEEAIAQAAHGETGSFVGHFAVNGEPRWWSVVVSPIRGPDGRLERLLAVSRDVTERILTEKRLQAEAHNLQLLNETGMALASRLGLQEVLQKVTDSATALSGAQFGAFFYNVVDADGDAYQLYTLAGAPRSAFENFGHPRATPVFAPTFRGEGIVRSEDITRDPRYGQWAPHHGMPKGHLPVRSYLAVPVSSRSGQVVGGLFFGHPRPGVFTERSEQLVAGIAAQAAVAVDNAQLFEAQQRAAREREQLLESERHARGEAERASRTKDEFLATLSHELRTPVSSILGWAHLLRARPPSPADLARGLEIIERNARLQTQLIEDLLDMSRITSGKLRLDVQPVHPITFVEAALETVRPAAEAKEIRLARTLDPHAGPVSGDPARLQQVIWNLLNNAIKFTPRGGKVHVVLSRVSSHIEISVADSGLGIEPEFLSHVFERFRQADGSTTRSYGGLGLGLSIVKQLVELHGGSVHAQSEGSGKGSTFTVSLPLSVMQAPSPSEGTRRHPSAAPPAALDFRPVDLTGIHVLVVDDQPDACELVARVLGECNATVRTATRAVDALALLKEMKADVLVSDIGMPEMDGYELIRAIRGAEDPQVRRMPAVAMTAFARSEDRTRALHAGFQVHVAKPVEPSELVATVASVTGRAGNARRD